ncbi:MAG: zinc ribbon domain-containing protein [Thaumarchaeota archaeon]|nr:zinc ribbon domain-containing protein [Nitrososphaerota archaeon]
MTEKLSKCPMCGTSRTGNSQTCSYCGYIFEDQLATDASTDEVSETRFNTSGAEPATPSTSFGEGQGESLLQSQPLVMCRGPKGMIQGTLLLTEKRLALVPALGKNNPSTETDVQNTLQKSLLTIPLDSIATVSGQRGILRLTLIVNWHDPPGNSATTRTEFVQRYRSPNPPANQIAINEWIPLIEKEALGESEEENFGATDLIELESQVLVALADMNWLGFFQLERKMEEESEKSIDPDDLDKVLEKLVANKVIEKDKVGEFYRKISSTK